MLRKISNLDLDLAYLALLTKTGLKPLSRWEKPVDGRRKKIIHSMGLRTAEIKRVLINGSSTSELVFSLSEKYIDLYIQKFSGTPIQKTPEIIRFEGFLFGFPSCCVENYILDGYSPNNLSKSDQEILFHWACPNCQITPLLLPEYRTCRDILLRSTATEASSLKNKIRKSFAVAASLSLLGGMLIASPSPGKSLDADPHLQLLSADVDQDQDYLEDRLEKILGLQSSLQDTDGNGIVDGIQIAEMLLSSYKSLPHDTSTTGPYVVDFMMWGLETCAVCGELTNMGYARIINPLENMILEVPYLSLHHFLEHGSLSYDGDVHGYGRVNAALMNIAVNGTGTSHKLLVENDGDDDGVADREEPFLGTNALQADSNGDNVPDGMEWSRTIATQIDSLPREQAATVYAIDHMMKGIENCHNCGEAINMGYMEIINPVRNLSLEVPYIAHHFMKCNGFSYEGDVHTGRLEIKQLMAVLETQGDEHQLPVYADADNDGLKNSEEPTFQTLPSLWDTNNNGIGDGAEAAQVCLNLVNNLPDTVQTDQPFKEHHMLRGIETCEVCGENVNMGFMRIVNPTKNDSMDVAYIAEHYLQHESFAYFGSMHQGRIDPLQLVQLLDYDPSDVQASPLSPDNFELSPNYPNPFNAGTIIPFHISGTASVIVDLRIFDAIGREILTLKNGNMNPGQHEIRWDGRTSSGQDASSGVYFIHLKTGASVKCRKMILLR